MRATPSPPAKAVVIAAVAVAIFAVSAAAILIRKAEAPPLAIAFWRNALATVFLLPLALRTGPAAFRAQLRPLKSSRKTAALAIASGVCLALHFGLWIPSLVYTSVAVSVVLVCTQPVFVAIFAAIVLREKTSFLGALAIAIAIGGVALIALNDDVAQGTNPHLGAILALGGAVTVAFYVLVGRGLRSTGVGLYPYVIVVYSVASLTLLLACLVLDVPLLGYAPRAWGWLLAIALGPQILGHTLMNWSLEHVPAPVLSATILAEPVVSAGLAWVVLDEKLTAQTAAGDGIVLSALALLLWSRARQQLQKESPA